MNLAFLLALASLSAEPSTTYAWPLELPRVLTSSFAEYRVGRYHMGIDLRTGAIGKDVFAAADGYVARVRCSPFGYGKAVYLQLNDGNMVVYAHLDDYAPSLRDYVQRTQHDRKKYTVDLYPDAGEFPFSRGDLIGKSGQTGIGVPHLHYEIRDRNGAPINPRLLGMTWPDSTAPTIRRAAVVPLEPWTRINGDMLPVVVSVRRGRSGGYVTDPVNVSGPVALGVDVIDPANGGGSRLGVHTLRAASGEDEIFRVVHDHISYGNDRDGVVAYHPFLLTQGRFLMLWRWPGNESELFTHTEGTGAIELQEPTSRISITATDFKENSTTLEIPLRSAAADDGPGAAASGQGRATVDFQHFDHWLIVSAAFSDSESETPLLRAHTDPPVQVPFRRIDARTFRAAYVPHPDATQATLSVVHPRADAREHHFIVAHRGAPAKTHAIGELEITTRPNSPYGTLFIRAEALDSPPGSTLRRIGPAYRISHVNAPIDVGVDIAFPLPSGIDDLRHVRVYRRSNKKWAIQDTTVKDGRLHVSTNRLGTFMAMQDPTPPTIRSVRPRMGQRVASKRPPIHATILDVGSGIYKFSATLNGQWLLMEYDPERGLLSWERDEDLPEGEGTLTFRVVDGAGNVTTREVQIQVAAGGD